MEVIQPTLRDNPYQNYTWVEFHEVDGNECGVPRTLFEDVGIWIHEFTEGAIQKVMKQYDPDYGTMLLGKHYLMVTSHRLTSCVCLSGKTCPITGRMLLIGPDEYWRLGYRKHIVKYQKTLNRWLR